MIGALQTLYLLVFRDMELGNMEYLDIIGDSHAGMFKRIFLTECDTVTANYSDPKLIINKTVFLETESQVL